MQMNRESNADEGVPVLRSLTLQLNASIAVYGCLLTPGRVTLSIGLTQVITSIKSAVEAEHSVMSQRQKCEVIRKHNKNYQ